MCVDNNITVSDYYPKIGKTTLAELLKGDCVRFRNDVNFPSHDIRLYQNDAEGKLVGII